ncbi:O-antigen polymerase [Streptococcus suis]
MLYILLTSIFLLIILELKLRKNFATPSVLLLLSFLMASLLIFINYKNWDISLSFHFVVYVLTAIISFILSTHLVHSFLKNSSKIPSLSLQKLQVLSRPRASLMLIMTVAFSIYSILYIRRVGFSLDLTTILSTAYSSNVLNSGYSGSFLETQMLKIITGIAYINYYQFLLSKFVVKMNFSQFINFYNIVLFLITATLSTDRNILLRFFIYALVLWILFFFDINKESMRDINFKIIRSLVIYGIVILISLFLAGRIKGYVSDFQRSIGLYGGSGLNNFNLFLNNFNGQELQWGRVTFNSLRVLVQTFLGIEEYSGLAMFDIPIVFKSSTGFVYISNVYSALRPFVLDFGYIGMLLFPAMVGIFFEILFSTAINRKFDFSWIFYSATVYSLIYFSIQEQFFARMHLGSLYEIFWLSIFYLYIKSPIKIKLRSNV